MKKSLIASLGILFSLVACTDYQGEYEDKYEALVSEPIEILDSSAKETIIDARDNQVYEVVQIGTQKWLARNLNYNDGKGKCPSEKSSLCEKYGRLYNASSIIKVHKSDKANGDQEIYDSLRALCPDGWHVPFKSEWKILKDYVASHSKKGEVGKNLKSTDGWLKADSMVEVSKDDIRFAVASGNDPYEFKALPAGICRGSDFSTHDNAYFWGIADTVRESFATMLMGYMLSFENDDFVKDGDINYLNNPRVSVRCIEGDRHEAYFDSSSLRNAKNVIEEDSSSSSEESSEEVEPSENTEKTSDGEEVSKDSTVKSSSSEAPSSASVAKSSASVASSASVVKSSSSIAASSSSVVKSSSSVVVKGKYDCSLYNCVITEYLNQDMLAAGDYGEYLDTRDDQVYRTVEIGTQTWMAQNLNYSTINSKCYAGDTANCKKYGRLYLQSDAIEVCPTGWHLPSKAEWEKLVENKGSTKGEVALNLEYTGWNNAYDLYGFSALPAGFKREDGKFFSLGTQTLFWTSATSGDIGFTDEYFFTSNSTSYGFSVRCLKGDAQTTPKSSSSSAVAPKSSSSVLSSEYDCTKYKCVTTEYLNQEMLAAGKYGEYLDMRDTTVYRTIKIGSQVWMAQNLNYKMKVSYCLNDTASYCAKYGRLYEYDSASKACPSGWRLPSNADWEDLYAAVGSSYKALWSTSFYSGTDEFGFGGVPTSVLDGNYSSKGYVKADAGFWWSSTSYVSNYNRTFELYKESVYFGYYGLKSRLAVRCIMK